MANGWIIFSSTLTLYLCFALYKRSHTVRCQAMDDTRMQRTNEMRRFRTNNRHRISEERQKKKIASFLIWSYSLGYFHLKNFNEFTWMVNSIWRTNAIMCSTANTFLLRYCVAKSDFLLHSSGALQIILPHSNRLDCWFFGGFGPDRSPAMALALCKIK